MFDRDEISARHIKHFLNVGKRMIAAFGEVRTSEMKPGRIEPWLLSLKNGEGQTLASATRNQIQRYVSLVFKYGVKIGVMTSNPLNGIEKAKSRKMKAVNILQPEQAETLLKNASREIIPFFAIGLFAGLRVDEIKKLDWKYTDLEHRKIDLTWFPTKTLQPRWVPIHVPLWRNASAECLGSLPGHESEPQFYFAPGDTNVFIGPISRSASDMSLLCTFSKGDRNA